MVVGNFFRSSFSSLRKYSKNFLSAIDGELQAIKVYFIKNISCYYRKLFLDISFVFS